MDVAALALVGALVLRGVYTTVRTRWPMHYFDLGESVGLAVDPVVSRSMGRYVLFRVGPVFVVATFVVVTAARWRRNEWLAGGLLLAWYAIAVAASVISDRRRSSTPSGPRSLAYWSSSAILIVASTVTAILLRDATEDLVPGPDELLAALWSASFAAVAGVLVFRQMSGRESSPEAQLKRSYDELDPELVGHARALCLQHAASADLAICIMVVENLQRPAWFRRLERVRGRVRRRTSATYGVMQVESHTPLSDRESIDRAIPRLAGTERGVGEDELAQAMRTAPTIIAYNSNPTFQAQLGFANLVLKWHGLLSEPPTDP